MTKISFDLKIKEKDLVLLRVEQLQQTEELLRAYAHVMHVPQHDQLSGKYIITIEVEGDLWDASRRYHDLIQELEGVVGYDVLEFPERPDVIETDKAVA